MNWKTLLPGAVLLSTLLVTYDCGQHPQGNGDPRGNVVAGRACNVKSAVLPYAFSDNNEILGSANLPVTFFELTTSGKRYMLVTAGHYSIQNGDSLGIEIIPTCKELDAGRIWKLTYPKSNLKVESPALVFDGLDGYVDRLEIR